MILGDVEIKRLIRHGMMDSADHVGPASVDIRLGNTFLIPKRKWTGVALGDEIRYTRREIGNGQFFPLKPGQFVLATTWEYVDLPYNIAAFVQGRSSIGRAGLTIQNAGFVDPGFFGHITLELVNESPNTILLNPGYRVGQLVFMQCTEVANPYNGKYNGQVEATGSRMHADPEGVASRRRAQEVAEDGNA